MRIDLTSVFVDDQDKALKFYTKILGFVKKVDVPVGSSGARWLTVVSPEDPGGTQLLLEPNGNPVAGTYQQGLFSQGIPATSFGTSDIQAEYRRLVQAGVTFTMEPTEIMGAIIAMFDDTCGNLIQIHQYLSEL